MSGTARLPGKLITVEGVEGAGKSTVLRSLEAGLREQGIDLQVSREPGGTPLAEEIRSLILAERPEPVLPMTELLLMFAARAQHLGERIRPALERGQWVLLDRFTDATYAYQGGGRGYPLPVIGELEQMVQGALRPDRTLILDLPVELGRARAVATSRPDRIEAEADSFFQRVRDSYLQRAAKQPQRYRVINAAVSPDEVEAAAWAALRDLVDEVRP